MYSSFKKQQLITESWRRFLNEVSDEEKKYFGDWMDEDFLDEFQRDVAKKVKQRKELEEYPTDKLNFIGEGSFRAVYRPEGDKDYVVKFALDRRNKIGKKMNQTEFDFQTKSNLFPKVFGHSNDFSWIIMESLETIKYEGDFNIFFPEINKMLGELGYTDMKIHEFIKETVFGPLYIDDRSGALSPTNPGGISYKDVIKDVFGEREERLGDLLGDLKYPESPMFQESILIPAIQELKRIELDNTEELKALEELENNLLDDETMILFRKNFESLYSNLKEIVERRLVRYCIDIPFVQKIREVIKKFKILPSEIRIYNTGVNSKGEFKILDASVKEQIG